MRWWKVYLQDNGNTNRKDSLKEDEKETPYTTTSDTSHCTSRSCGIDFKCFVCF